MNKKTVSRVSKLLKPTDQQKRKMLQKILENKTKPMEEERAVQKNRFRHVLVSAILVCCIITTTAFAATYLGLETDFLDFLKVSNNKQAEFLANGAYTVNKQIKNKNGTLEIKQVIGDSNLTYILMDFTAPKGVVLNADRYRFQNYDTKVSTYNDFYSTEFRKLPDKDPNDNKISLVMAIETKKSLMDGNIKLTLEDLEAAANLPKTFDEAAMVDPQAQIFKPLISGKWKTSFRLGFQNCSKTYEPNKNITLYGYEATLSTISVSPISITITFESPHTKEIHHAAPFQRVEYDTYLDDFPVTINYKDGTKETTTYFNGTTVGSNMSNTTISIKRFEKLINDKEIDSITFFDTLVKLN